MGGVEKELIAVLKQIYDRYDITLLLLHMDDENILSDIPDSVKIINMNIDKDYYYGSTFSLVKQRLKRGKFIEASTLALKRCLNIGVTGSNINLKDIPELKFFYDIAVCYHIHSPLMLKYVAEKVIATKKIAWIHNDFYTSKYKIQRLKKYVLSYAEFVAVSKKVENEFRAICTWYQGGISTAYNYLDTNEIETLSQETVDCQEFTGEKNVRILTIGRFSEQKGIDIAIEACRIIKKKNLDFHWFLIGYGELEDQYRRLIEKYNIEDCFTILGKKMNPYPYIRCADIYVQPSRHEAYPLAIMEAKILKRPIICTDFDGADEQIKHGVNGIIVPLNDVYALEKEVSELILSKKKRDELSKKLETWSSDDELREIVKHFE